jgi:hypothetical protein
MRTARGPSPQPCVARLLSAVRFSEPRSSSLWTSTDLTGATQLFLNGVLTNFDEGQWIDSASTLANRINAPHVRLEVREAVFLREGSAA